MNKMTVKEAKEQFFANNKKVVDDSVDGFIVLKDVNKVYNNRVQAVFNFNLSVQRNEFIVLVGPSGCGKSTTLRMIAGLEEITDGNLYIDNILANYLESKDRDIAMVFQSYALYPNMTVYDNIGFGLQVRGLPKDEIKAKVFKAAEILDLGPYLDRRPKELSGGQMQRVALGRAIVRDAKLFLMDEPLSNLDAKLRVQMRSEIVKLHRSINATTIYVTHDQTEAMTMADRIVVMNQGVVQQIGTPIEIYNNPANAFVATFIGNPPMNVFKTSIEGGILKNGDDKITLPQGVMDKYYEFIAERREFFAQLKQKAQFTEEKQLKERVTAFRKTLRKTEQSKIKEEMAEICAELLKLSKQKGLITFTEEQADAYLSDVDNGHRQNVISDSVAMENLIDSSVFTIAGILKQSDSSGAFTTNKKVTIVSKKQKQHTESLEEEVNRKIDEYISAYGSKETETHALVGIRPEDVYFSDKFDGNKTEDLNLTVDFVEMLGSDYCMHVNLFGSDVIVKRGIREVVSTGDKIKLCIDKDKIKLFDPVSGKTINR